MLPLFDYWFVYSDVLNTVDMAESLVHLSFVEALQHVLEVSKGFKSVMVVLIDHMEADFVSFARIV